MHLGEVPMQPITDSLIALAKKGELLSRKYVRRKSRAVETREAAAPVYLERVKNCLGRVVDYAASKNIRLGIEGRRGYEEIPSERELPGLLDEMNSPQLGYWHDFGHIQIKENLAFLDHAEWLRRSLRARSVVTYRTAFGRPRIISRLLPEISILRNLFRSCHATVCLSGK